MLRIKRVIIQGFKTFARKTEFIFDPGVTAIVGPNGSGKSNVADAVRWCLGEQSFATLRSKKTADVIFSGSDEKARLGMATVSLTLDNSDGELPIDFSEVEITRRAYRDGENEYLLNNQKVRLLDITQLLAPSGLGKRTYAVIGQGLIDQVLSLKPEQRRALFEEAAGITGYQAKRATALRRLEATQSNLERVQDILAELSPRLQYLRRQAERAKEREQVEADLHGLLRQWYGYRWHHTLQTLRQQRADEETCREATTARQERLEAVSARIEDLRKQQSQLRERLNQQHLLSSERHRQAEKVGRELAVAQERYRQLQSRQEENQRELADLRLQQETVTQRLTDLGQTVEAAQETHRQRQDAVASLQHTLRLRQQERATLLDRLEAAQAQQRRLEEEITDRRSRLEQLDERRRDQQTEQEHQEAARRKAEAAAETVAQELAQAEEAYDAVAQRVSELRAETEVRQETMAGLRRQLEEAETQRRNADRLVDRLQTRYDLLERLRNEGAGYASGVRAVLQKAQSRGEKGKSAGDAGLSGILGTVASLLRVPAELDKAIETALGGAFQNLVTENWDDAQRAIAYLKQSRQGRATFLPLDRLYVPSRIPAPAMTGMLGNAADLVDCDPRVADAAGQLLNRVWVAESLSAARRALDSHGRGPRPTVVTLTGEIVRPGGAISGGSDNRRRDDSVLAREREFRELPAQIDQAEQRTRKATALCSQLSARIESTQTELGTQRQELDRLAKEERQQQQQLEALRLRLAQARQSTAWQADLLAQTRQELAQFDRREDELEQELAQLARQRQEAQVAVDEAKAVVAENSIDDLLRKLADLRTEAAEAQGHLQSQRTLLENQRRAQQNIQAQIQSKEQRLGNLDEEIQALAEQIEQSNQIEATLSRELGQLKEAIDPAEAKLAKLEKAQEEAEAQERKLQHSLRQDESRWNAAQLKLQRTEDRLETLQRDIRHDFGLAEMAEQSDDMPYQPPLPFQTLVAQLPVVDELPQGLAEEVEETRARLRRLSNVNPEAPKEYEEAAGRHEFLTSQSQDLEAAAADLRRVIRELDTRMESELRRTFEEVSREFVHFFKLLFRGGTAQLSLTEPEDIINTGIEIVARPPGKRPQSLELLSGGERSLTACALIFAILRISPTPFCILDEVDAALDEANVDRFREVLEGLGDQTQFILITHNRRTLEASNTIYGITMGSDGISRVISLRLEGDEIVREDGNDEQTSQPPASIVKM